MALGTPFSLEAGYIIAGEEQISEEKWRGMIDCVSEDPTFSTFFGKKFDALPDKVKHMMRNPGMRGWIEETIVPVYKRQTDKLISDRAKS